MSATGHDPSEQIATPDANGWMPIETAPKDRPIQLYSMPEKRQVVAFWGTAVEDSSTAWIYARQLDFHNPENAIAFFFTDPTHWRETFEPPVQP